MSIIDFEWGAWLEAMVMATAKAGSLFAAEEFNALSTMPQADSARPRADEGLLEGCERILKEAAAAELESSQAEQRRAEMN